jgi:integrase
VTAKHIGDFVLEEAGRRRSGSARQAVTPLRSLLRFGLLRGLTTPALVMLSRLGLRAGELAALTLEDVDWRAGEIDVPGKGGRRERLPLPADVGQALVGYLRRGRPETADRHVFVRFCAPRTGLSPGGVSAVVHAAGDRAGIAVTGAHQLRHTAAAELLRGGAPLSEISQLLRHCRPATTAIYAKVDRSALRPLAPHWPAGVR